MESLDQRLILIWNVKKMDPHSIFLNDTVEGGGNPLCPHHDAATVDHVPVRKGKLDLKLGIGRENKVGFQKNSG